MILRRLYSACFTLLFLVWMAVPFSGPVAAKEANPLTGAQVVEIADRFIRSHYSHDRFDNNHSQKMLKGYLNQFDPDHYFFLQSDIEEFQQYENRLDDLMNEGNIDPAFVMFNRFKQRLAERNKQIKQILKTKFDWTPNESIQIDRKEAPYPANEKEAQDIWRLRLKFDVLEQKLDGKSEKAARKKVEKRYSGYLNRIKQFTHNDVVTTYLNTMIATFDPHSLYMPPDELENFNINLRLSLEGIGATLRSEDSFTIVTSIIPHGAADREGTLQPEDKIIAVGQGASSPLEEVRNMRLSDVVKLIRGARGSKVRIAFLRLEKGGLEKRHEVVITRDRIELEDGAASGKIHTIPDPKGTNLRLGVITLPSFYVDFRARRNSPSHYKSSALDVQKILAGFIRERVDGVILDLRNNGGGGLNEVVSLVGLFMGDGPVVMVKDNNNDIGILDNPNSKPLYRGPLVVMTNRFSASASEILAGAIKDYGRGILVGDTSTFGKGTVQNVFPLSDTLGALKVTIAKFYRPGSASTQNQGVTSDVVLPSMNSYMDIGESSLENALSWDSLQRAKFRPWGDLSPYLPVLARNSAGRVAHQKEFMEINGHIAEYVKNKKDRKTISIQEMTSEAAKQKKEDQKNKADKNKPGAKKDKADKKDIYLDETMDILTDFIQMARNDPAYGIANSLPR